jgi:hypothetical protein
MRGGMSTIQSSVEMTAPGERRGWIAWIEARRWAVVALYLALTAIALYPVFSVSVPPLVDYPNHLARMHILANWATDPALQRNYVVGWSLHPNMAMDLIVPVLARVMPVYMAGKLFVAATMLSLLGGTLVLRKALVGRVGLWPVLTFLLLYNHALFWGFLSYLFTAGLALFAFAGWIALRDSPVPRRIAVHAVVAVILYVGHLFGLFVYALLVFGYEIWRTRQAAGATPGRLLGAWTVAGAQFAIPGILFLVWIAEHGATAGALTRFGSLTDRASIFMAPVNIGLPSVDVPALVLLAAAWLLCRSGAGVTLAPSARIPLLVTALAALVLPAYLSGVWGVHLRLPTVVACLLVAAVDFRQAPWRPMPFVVGATLILVAIRTGEIAFEWRAFDRTVAELRQAVAVIEPGARLLPVEDDGALPPNMSPLYPKQHWHLPAIAVIERSVFLPTLFTGHTTIDAAPALRAIDTSVGDPISPELLAMGADPAASPLPLGYRLEHYMRAYWIDWPRQFGYLLYIHFGRSEPLDPERLRPVERGRIFDIFRVVRPGAAIRNPASGSVPEAVTPCSPFKPTQLAGVDSPSVQRECRNGKKATRDGG